MAKYSILTTDRQIIESDSAIDELLNSGIKLILMCDENDKKRITANRGASIKASLLNVHTCDGSLPEVKIVDGVIATEDKELIKKVCDMAEDFNYEQYIIEHAPYNRDIIVEAGAGTGKTKVMIDRILYLIHVVPELRFDEIAMITFTNEATMNMRHKLQEVLVNRYKATGLKKYIDLLEQQATLDIQTIHSFSRNVISEMGSAIGYGNRPKVKSLKHEKRQIVYDVLNDLYKTDPGEVERKLGLTLHEMANVIMSFWNQMDNLGLTDEEVEALDWGKEADIYSEALQRTLKSTFSEANNRYYRLKLESDAFSVNDIIKELQRIVMLCSEHTLRTTGYKYVFVDEFQDSDNAQIRILAMLKKLSGLTLFVVGDVKQSIYRFRGAVETAFQSLKSECEVDGKNVFAEYRLIRNYRTCVNVMSDLNDIFTSWNRKDLIPYSIPILAQNSEQGNITVTKLLGSGRSANKELSETLKTALSECVAYAEANNCEDKVEQRVTVLTRTNYQLNSVRKACKAANIPCYIREEGSFYASAAVQDFYAMVRAFTFPRKSRHILDFVNSSYSRHKVQIKGLLQFEAGSEEQLRWLIDQIDNVDWEYYKKMFRLKPVLSVLRDIVETSHPEEIYVETNASELDMSYKNMESQKNLWRMQYRANLEKLFRLLRNNFSGSMVSLYGIYEFLKIRINTDLVEDEPDISKVSGCRCIYGMTVHRAKGLEFDTVIIPYTDKSFYRSERFKLLIEERNKKRIAGWECDNRGNTYYESCLEKEQQDILKEETRLLYVALTRTIRSLHYFVNESEKDGTWSFLLGN